MSGNESDPLPANQLACARVNNGVVFGSEAEHPLFKRKRMARKFIVLLALAALVVSPAAGFDSYWHAQCTQEAGESTGFSEDAWKIVQLGDFSPDLFGPIAEYRQGCGPFV